jgi:hypothetical protein
MKKIIFLSSILIVVSCSSKDEQFCKCLKAGDELNAFSSKLFDKEITPKMQKEMQKLRSTKASACKNYQTMDGKKMLELKEECK